MTIQKYLTIRTVSNNFWHQIKVQQMTNKTKTIQKEKRSKQFVKDLTWRVTWTGSMRRSAIPSKHCRFMSAFWNLLDQRPGLIVVATLVGFVLFDLSHVLCPSIALAWLDLQERRHKVITSGKVHCFCPPTHTHTKPHLRLCRFSASSQPCRSLGTLLLCASPPGLGDRRLKPL